MEDDAVPDTVFHGLFEAHVEEHRPVKRLCASLHRANQREGQKCCVILLLSTSMFNLLGVMAK